MAGLSVDQLHDRANRIWGPKRVISVYPIPATGGLDVNCIRLGMASDCRGRTFTAHRLDATGTPTCHTDCMVLATEQGL